MKTDINESLKVLAPVGSLRVAIAVGSAVSAVWTTRDAETGEPRGPTVDLARLIAARIGAPLTLVEYPSSGAIIAAASTGAWDVSFTPVDAERKQVVDFGPNYFLGESTYMVPAGSSIRGIEDVDREGVRVYGVENTATIRSARKSLTNTTAVGLSNLEDALERFRNGEVDALALGKESLQSLLSQFPGARMLDGHFHATGTAVAVPKGHTKALEVFSSIIEELKSDGIIRKIFNAHGMEAATVAPVGSRS
ncbi:transporter substrate-binding domain-containing protein [Microvirga sp. KLBC 81]|uniref:transporter substrate-binding domain-containing protein n=1 Tax=Microvirga sp. KLBC 81 TaxID=1862707 RepID=UPI0014026155|nr:transporter substrate-binding domain-containing protein [Microvirga sp. KLBC 81]